MPESAHFKESELKCECCGANEMTHEALAMAEEFRAAAGSLPVTVNSAYRCYDRNLAVGGEPHSQHLQGRALDVSMPGMTAGDLEAIARKCPSVVGLGRDDFRGFLHIDCRLGYAPSVHRPAAVWCYDANGKSCVYYPHAVEPKDSV